MLRKILYNFRDLGSACKSYFLKSDIDLAVLVLAATSLLIPPMNYLDFINYGWSADYLATTAFEAVLIAFSIVLIVILRRTRHVRVYENLVFAWSCFISASAAYIVLVQTGRIIENILFNALLLIAFYVILSNRALYRLIPAVLILAASVTALVTSQVASFQNKYMLALTLLVINAIGPFIIVRTNQFKRKIYKTQKSEREARQMYEWLATIDSLTGILNRRSFFEQAQREYARYERFRSAFCLAVLDLDCFKNVNDQYSHLAGDEVLKRISGTVASVKRPYDIFGRLGGDEFGLLLPHTNLADAKKVVARIQEAVRKTLIVSQQDEFTVTFSAGIAGVGKDDVSLDDIFRRADQALYLSKEHGRDRIETLS